YVLTAYRRVTSIAGAAVLGGGTLMSGAGAAVDGTGAVVVVGARWGDVRVDPSSRSSAHTPAAPPLPTSSVTSTTATRVRRRARGSSDRLRRSVDPATHGSCE